MKVIGTWKMAYEAFEKQDLNQEIDQLLINSMMECENNPNVHTIGQYSYPNYDGYLELDAAFMDGKSLMAGAVMGARKLPNPILAAYDLSKHFNNCFLHGDGADKYAKSINLKTQDKLISYCDIAHTNHDTCGMVALDKDDLKIAISSSGRKNKLTGRIGDSPLIGSGFYADNKLGGLAFTGDGETIAKGVLAKAVLDDFRYSNNLQASLIKVCDEYLERTNRKNDLVCAVGIDSKGNFVAYTANDDFPFGIIDDGNVKLYYAYRKDGKHYIKIADETFLERYKGD